MRIESHLARAARWSPAVLLILVNAELAVGAPATPGATPAVAPAPGAPVATPAPVAAKASAAAVAKPALARSGAVARPAPSGVRARLGRSAAARDTAQTLKGGQEGTVFRALTVEGEDRIHFEVERPGLDLDLDPDHAPGLEPGDPRATLERDGPDFAAPLLALTAREPSPYLARPWLTQFADGAVASFRPQVTAVERWRLTIADSRGQQVAGFEGRGAAPREIRWDGRTRSGRPAIPGLTYSYVFEAFDRAGNKRNFVGQGFKIPPLHLDTATGPVLVFAGEDLSSSLARGPSSLPGAPALIVLEAASWINHEADPARRLRVVATARSAEQANALAAEVARQLRTLTLGDPARIQAAAEVVADSPAAGTVRIEPGN